MAKNALLSAVVSVLLLAGCGADHAEGIQAPELLRAVPSDALAVMCFDRCDRGFECALDSTDALNGLSLGHLSSARAVIAMDNVGSLERLLVLDAGRAAADTSDQVRDILGQSERTGLSIAFVAGSDSTINRNVILASRSGTVVSVARRHIVSGTSILDAPGFTDAFSRASSSRDIMVLRNSGADRLLAPETLNAYFPRKKLRAFLRGTADWTLVDASEAHKSRFSVRECCAASPKYFANVLAKAAPADSRIAELVPEDVEFILDLPVADRAAYREAYELWLDASSSLDSYRKKLKSLCAESGKDPLAWEKEIGVREVARVCMEYGSLTMVRAARCPKIPAVEANPYRGFIPALFGSAFASASDSCAVSIRDWLVTGSAESLGAFMEESGTPGIELPGSSTLTVYCPAFTLSGNGNDFSLIVNKI